MGKLKLSLVLLIGILAGCVVNAAQVAGPMPDYSVAPSFASPHRRIPQSSHGLSGVVADIRWESKGGSEKFHIGDWNQDSRQDLPAYQLSLEDDFLAICIYALNVPHQQWSDKLNSIASESKLVEAIFWELPQDQLYVLLRLDLAQPVQYRSWYYTNTGYFTIELTPADTS